MALHRNRRTESARAAGSAFEVGPGLTSNLSRHFALKPAFDLSDGFLSFNNIKTTYGNGTTALRLYNPGILTFNVGLAIACKF